MCIDGCCASAVSAGAPVKNRRTFPATTSLGEGGRHIWVRDLSILAINDVRLLSDSRDFIPDGNVFVKLYDDNVFVLYPVEYDMQVLAWHVYLLQHAAIHATLHKYVAEHWWQPIPEAACGRPFCTGPVVGTVDLCWVSILVYRHLVLASCCRTTVPADYRESLFLVLPAPRLPHIDHCLRIHRSPHHTELPASHWSASAFTLATHLKW